MQLIANFVLFVLTSFANNLPPNYATLLPAAVSGIAADTCVNVQL